MATGTIMWKILNSIFPSKPGVIVKRDQNSFRNAIPFSNCRSDSHIFGPDKETAYNIQINGAVKLNGSLEIRSNKTFLKCY